MQPIHILKQLILKLTLIYIKNSDFASCKLYHNLILVNLKKIVLNKRLFLRHFFLTFLFINEKNIVSLTCFFCR